MNKTFAIRKLGSTEVMTDVNAFERMYGDYTQGYTFREIAEKYNIGASMVYRIFEHMGWVIRENDERPLYQW